jgi:hypothetical protein
VTAQTQPVGLDRRTLLVGAAATAGVAAAAAASTPTAAAATPSALATPAAPLGGAALVAASDVSVLPAGEIIDTDAQAALEALDRRLSKVNLIDDLQVAMTLVDDFMGNTTASGTIGELGWALAFGGTGTVAVGKITNEPGLYTIGTGTTATGYQNLNLGNNNLRGAPTLLYEWRLRRNALNTGSDASSCWFGLHNNLSGGEPTTGLYFRTTAADGAAWQAVCANAGDRTVVDTAIVVDTLLHRFRVTCDGAGIARYYIDSALVATVLTSVPTTNRHSPCLSIRKTAGTIEHTVTVDYFALRFEHPR